VLRKIEISHRTIIFTVLFLISLLLLYRIRDIIFDTFLALLIMAILNPTVTRLSKLGVPRPLSILLTYLFVIALFVVAIAGVVPPLIDQTTSFINSAPSYFSNLGVDAVITEQIETQLLSQITRLPGEAVRVGVSVFSNIITILFVLAFAFYLLLARDKLDEQLSFFFGEEREREIARIIDLLEERLGGWARGELSLMALIGVASFIGLTILRIPYALPLAILSGLFEILPYFGPILSGIPIVILGLSISPIMGLATLALIFLIHQTENYVFVPKVMEKSAGANPIVSLLSLTIGFNVMGIVGAFISIPVVLALQVLATEYIRANKKPSL
jgi:predicted PurR-regulated permease PerM